MASSTLQTDNCPREGKNQIMARLSAAAIITRKPHGLSRCHCAALVFEGFWISWVKATFVSSLVADHILRFKSVTHIWNEVGHTHGPVDQRLGICSSAFVHSEMQCLEDLAVFFPRVQWLDRPCVMNQPIFGRVTPKKRRVFALRRTSSM